MRMMASTTSKALKDKKLDSSGQLINDITIADQYINDVINNKIVVCQYIKKAVLRHVNDLKNKKEFYFDRDEANRILTFFCYLKHSKGKEAGKVIKLEPWQCFMLSTLMGWKKVGTNNRRFSTVYFEMARKNGKSTVMAGLSLYCFLKDGENSPEIYSAATKKDQAKIIFEECKNMVKQSKPLKKRVKLLQQKMILKRRTGKLEPLASDANSLDGLNTSVAIIDELHAHKTSAVYDVMKSSQGSRENPLLISITTAGFNLNGICKQMRDYAVKVVDGSLLDDAFFGLIYTLDEGDDWRADVNWIKANPNLGVSVSIDYISGECKQAEALSSQRVNFLTKHCNVWVSSSSSWINSEDWTRIGNSSLTLEQIDKDVGIDETYIGVDLSKVDDITSAGIFVIDKEGQKYIFSKNYLPEEAIEKARAKRMVAYDNWVEDGWLISNSGRTINHDFMIRDIIDLDKKYGVTKVFYDRWESDYFKSCLEDESIETEKFGQGYQSMSPAIKEMQKLILNEEIIHDNNPIVAWTLSNVVLTSDPAGNVKIDKDKGQNKVDPIVALVMAVGGFVKSYSDSSRKDFDDYLDNMI